MNLGQAKVLTHSHFSLKKIKIKLFSVKNLDFNIVKDLRIIQMRFLSVVRSIIILT